MLNTTDRRIAEKAGILPKIEKLHGDLLRIPGVPDIDYDLRGYLDDIREVIILPRYEIDTGAEYWKEKARIICDIFDTWDANGLRRTGDRIEDDGNCYYIVLKGW